MAPLTSPYGNGPDNLEPPVPNTEDMAQAASPQGVQAPLPGASAAPSPTPGPNGLMDVGIGEQVTPEEAQALARSASPEVANAVKDASQTAGVSPYFGKTVKAKLFGQELRVNPDGKTIEAFNSRKKKWEEVSDTYKEFLGSFYHLKRDFPAFAGSLVGQLSPFGPAGRVVGAATGAAIGEHFFGGTDLNKESETSYLLRKAAGVEDETSGDTKDLKAAALGGGAQLVGEGIGSLLSKKEKQLLGERNVLSGLDKLAAPRQELADAARDLDVPIHGMQLIKDLPGSQLLTKPELNIMGRVADDPERMQLEQFYANQQKALHDRFTDVISKVAPGVDFANLETNKILYGENGQKPLNLFGRIAKGYGDAVAVNRAAVSQLAKDKEFDPSPVLRNFETTLKDFFKFDERLFDPDGSINFSEFKKLTGNEGYSDAALKDFGKLYFTLKNAQKRVQVSRPFRAQEGATGNDFGLDPQISEMMLGRQNVNEDLKGLTFDQLTSFNDTLQKFAAFDSKDRTPFQRAIGKVAHGSRLLEDDVITKTFLDANQPGMANRVLNMKQKYANNIDAINHFDDLLSKNPDNASEVIFNMPKDDFKKALSLMDDSQIKEVRGSLLLNALSDAVNQDVTKNDIQSLSGAKLFNQFIKDPVTHEKFQALFGEDAKSIDRLIGLARLAELKQYQGKAAEAVGGKVTAALAPLIQKMNPLKLMSFTKGIFAKSPEVADVVGKSLDALMELSAKRQASLASQAELIRAAQKANKYILVPGLKLGKRTMDLVKEPYSLLQPMFQDDIPVDTEDLH